MALTHYKLMPLHTLYGDYTGHTFHASFLSDPFVSSVFFYFMTFRCFFLFRLCHLRVLPSSVSPYMTPTQRRPKGDFYL